MNWSEIISDPAFGNFVVMLVFFRWLKWKENSPADSAAEQVKKILPSLIITCGAKKRKVG